MHILGNKITYGYVTVGWVIKNGIAVVVGYAIGLVIGFIFFVFVLCYFYRLSVADWFAIVVCVYEVY